MNFGHPEPISQGQSLALEPIDLRANGGLHRANFSKLALQRASWQHWSKDLQWPTGKNYILEIDQ